MLRRISINTHCIVAALTALLLLAGFSVGAFAKSRRGKTYENILDFGSCGRHLFWKYENGVLKIRGFGPMDNYPTPYDAPYSPFAKDIVSVVLSDSVTSIGF